MSIVGLVYRVEFGTHPDATWNLFSVNIVKLVDGRRINSCISLLISNSTVEVDVGILCACMPCFPSIFKRTNILHSILAPFKSIGSRLSNSKRNGRNADTLEKASSAGSDFSDYIQHTHPSRLRDGCIEYGKSHILGKSAVKIAVVAKPASVVRSSAFLWGIGQSRVTE